MSVLSGRYGWRTWLEFVLTRWKKWLILRNHVVCIPVPIAMLIVQIHWARLIYVAVCTCHYITWWAKYFKWSYDYAKRSFHLAANFVISEVGRVASEESVLELTNAIVLQFTLFYNLSRLILLNVFCCTPLSICWKQNLSCNLLPGGTSSYDKFYLFEINRSIWNKMVLVCQTSWKVGSSGFFKTYQKMWAFNDSGQTYCTILWMVLLGPLI